MSCRSSAALNKRVAEKAHQAIAVMQIKIPIKDPCKVNTTLLPAKPTIGLCFTDDADLAGPLIFCLLFGSLLLASGNVHFGYIYGMALMACGGNLIFLNSWVDVLLFITTKRKNILVIYFSRLIILSKPC